MILTILILSLFLRVTNLNQSLWLDEATSAIVAKMSLTDFFSKFIVNDFHPPLYYLFLHFWSRVVGFGEVPLRVFSVFVGVLTVYFIYKLGFKLKLKSPETAALLLATSGLHIYYSQEARMYGLATLFVVMAVNYLLEEKWLKLSILIALIFLTDYVSILIVPAIFVFLIISKKNSKWFKNFFLSLLIPAITFIGWLPIFIKQLMQGVAVKETASNWWNILGVVSLKNILLVPIKFVFGRITFDNKAVYYGLAFVLILFFAYIMSRSKNKLLWSWFGVSFSLGIILSVFIPTLTYFRYLFILPAFYLLISEGLERLRSTFSKYLLAVIVIFNLICSGLYLIFPRFQREDWRSLALNLGSSKIVFPANSQKEGLIYYNKEKNIASASDLTEKDREIYLSRYVYEIFDQNDSTRAKLEKLGYNKVSEDNYNGIVVFRYKLSK